MDQINSRNGNSSEVLEKTGLPQQRQNGINSFSPITLLRTALYIIQNRGELFKNMWKLFMDYVDGSGINV